MPRGYIRNLRELLLGSSGTCLIASILVIVISCGLLLAASGTVNSQGWVSIFEPYGEILLSSPDMDCNYYLEDERRLFFNFQYPQVIILDGEEPIIAYIDERSNRLIFSQISGDRAKTITSLPNFGEHLWQTKWPIIFTKEKTIYLAVITNAQFTAKDSSGIVRIYTLNRDKYRLNLQEEIHVARAEIRRELVRKSASFFDVQPCDKGHNRFVLLGLLHEYHFTPGGLLSGHHPSFAKNFSLIWESGKADMYNMIEEAGWYGVRHPAYAVSESGAVFAAWVRDTSYTGSPRKHDETVFYSESKAGLGWTKPIEVYTTRDTEIIRHISDLSTTFYNDSGYILWRDIQ